MHNAHKGVGKGGFCGAWDTHTPTPHGTLTRARARLHHVLNMTTHSRAPLTRQRAFAGEIVRHPQLPLPMPLPPPLDRRLVFVSGTQHPLGDPQGNALRPQAHERHVVGVRRSHVPHLHERAHLRKCKGPLHFGDHAVGHTLPGLLELLDSEERYTQRQCAES